VKVLQSSYRAIRSRALRIDLQGHGRTALGDRQISVVDMGNDMAGVLKKLGYDKVDVLGYSMGGGVAFQFAVQHPEMSSSVGAAFYPLRAGRVLSGNAAAAGVAQCRDGGAFQRMAGVCLGVIAQIGRRLVRLGPATVSRPLSSLCMAVAIVRAACALGCRSQGRRHDESISTKT